MSREFFFMGHRRLLVAKGGSVYDPGRPPTSCTKCQEIVPRQTISSNRPTVGFQSEGT